MSYRKSEVYLAEEQRPHHSLRACRGLELAAAIAHVGERGLARNMESFANLRIRPAERDPFEHLALAGAQECAFSPVAAILAVRALCPIAPQCTCALVGEQRYDVDSLIS